MATKIENMDRTESEMTFNPNDRTLYVAGLTRDTTDIDIQSRFLSFGQIALINHKTNLMTGESRGFAFVTFENMDDFEKAMNTDEHYVKNKKVVVKKAQPKQGIIFVGKLPKEEELSDESIKEYFSRYGVVDGIKHPMDKVRGVKKNFCFVYFQSTDSAKAVLSLGKVMIENFELEVGKATLNPSNDLNMFAGSNHMPGVGGFGPGNIPAYGPFPGYAGVPVAYGGMPYGGYVPMMSPYGGYNPRMPFAMNGGFPGLTSYRSRGRGFAQRGRGGMRGQRNRPY